MNHVSKSLVALSVATLASVALTQSRPAPPSTRPGGGGGDKGGTPNVDPLQTVKTQLRASDEEWKIIVPAVRKVMAARQAADGGLAAMNGGNGNRFGPRPGGGFGGPRGFGGPGGFGGPPANDSFNGPAGPGQFNGPPGGGRGGMGGGGPGGNWGPPPWDTDNRDDPRPDAANKGDPNDRAGGGRPSDNRDGNGNGNGNGNGGGGGNGNGNGGGGGPGGPGGFGGFGPGGPGGGGAIVAAMAELKTAAADASVPADRLAAKVAAVRDLRTKARADLAAAEAALVTLLTPDQEATLVALGYLE